MAFTIFFTIIFEFTFISDKKYKKVRNKKKKKKEEKSKKFNKEDNVFVLLIRTYIFHISLSPVV